jgi:DNA helicase II / ATP-dependent DNA helicase PcrA
MRYATLPFAIPGVTHPSKEARSGGREPTLVREWPQERDAQRPRPIGASRRQGARSSPTADPPSLLSLLDREQRLAVTHGGGPLLIRAGPGTGKTHTLAARMAYLVEAGIARPQELLALTFTRRAAEELRRRLIDLVGVERAAGLNVWTIHRLCARLVRAHADELGRNKDYTICDRPRAARRVRAILGEERCEPVRAELARSGERLGEELVRELLEQIGGAKNRLWSLPEYLERSAHPQRALVGAVWDELERRLRDANELDFEDLIVCAVALLRHRCWREHYRERYRWLLIDEFQDVNIAQLELVRLLMAPDGNLTAVGDEDQCLYGFRSADPEQMLAFGAEFPAATQLTITRNRRNRPEILDAAQRLIEHNTARVPKGLIPLRQPGASLGVRRYRTDRHEARDIAGLVATELRIGRDPRELLVLCREREPLRRLRYRLEHEGIKVRLLGEPSRWQRSELVDALALLRLLANPYDAQAFRRAVGAPSDREPFRRGGVRLPDRGVGERVEPLVRFADAVSLDLIEALLDAGEVDGFTDEALHRLERFALALDDLRARLWARRRTGASLAPLIEQALWIPTGPFETYTLLAEHARERKVREDAGRVIEDLRSLIRAARGYEESTAEPRASLAGFLDGLDPDTQEIGAAEDDRVTLATVHTAKGTEAQTVIVIGCEEDWRASTDQAQLEALRRVYYVAFTRAKDNLLLTHVAARDGTPAEGPTRCLAEAGVI